jgi:predicted dehydrogenase
MSKERCILVGAGGISGAWFKAMKAEKANLVAVVDLDVDRAYKRIKEFEYDCEVSSNLVSMLRKHKPAFVIDCTVPEAHCEVTCTALKNGAHVVGEKPLAASMAQARRMVRTAEQTGMMYMVSQSRRWNAQHDSVRRTITGGAIGAVTTINCDFYIGAHFGGFRDKMPSPLILDMAIHHFDLARYMIGADPVAVYAKEFNPRGSWYKGDVAATCIFEMSNNVVFTYRGSWCAEGMHTSWNGDWRIIGDKGTLIYDHDQPPKGEVLAGNEGFHRPKRELKVAKSQLKFGGMHGALREMLTFLRTGKKPQTECHDNIKSLAMVFGAIESSRRGKRILIKC